jgi:KDO2-lipid IV(A) lauroyltransferase
MPVWQSVPLWGLLTSVGLLFTFLPRFVEVFIGPRIGRLAFFLAAKRRRIAEGNIGRCFPELSDGERADLLRRNCEHWGMIGLEFMHLFSPVPGHFARYVKKVSVMHNFENWEKAHDKGKGTIIVGCHAGNWEVASAAGALAGMSFTIVTRNLTPDWLMKKIENSRLQAGLGAFYQPRTVPSILRALRKGHCVGFVIDQYAAPPMGVKVRFFGYSVDTLAAVGPLAQRTGAAVVPTYNYRDEKGIFHVYLEPELNFGDAAVSPEESTQILADMVEAQIRANPAQWTWGHRRFKNVDFSDRMV